MVQAGRAVEEARQAQRGDTGIIKVGIASGLGTAVSRVVLQFGKTCPAVDVECRDIFSSFQSDMLRRREIDVGFLRPPLDHMALNCELVYEEEFVVILPKFHRLAKRRALRIHDIADERLIIFDRSFSSGLYDKIVGLYSRHGLTPRLIPTHVEAHEEAGAITVASGKAIFIGAGAIVSRSVAGIELASVRLNEPEAKIEVYAVWRQDEASPNVSAFLDCVRATFPPQKQRPHTAVGDVRTSLFPRDACEKCSYARTVRTGR
jgi:DNA-binding transcriptional LysR family regulator